MFKFKEVCAFLLVVVGCLAFIPGVPICVVFSLRWSDSVIYEHDSVDTNCTIVALESTGLCTGGRGNLIGHTWAYDVATPACDDIIHDVDDQCNFDSVISNQTFECHVHNDCGSFKSKHNTNINRKASFVGSSLVLLSIILCGISIYLHKEMASKPIIITPDMEKNCPEVEVVVTNN